MRVLGVDLALRRSGYAIVDGDVNVATFVESGVIETGTKPHDIALAHITECLRQVIARTRPDIVYIEVPGAMNTVKGRSIQTVVALAEAKGAVLGMCATVGVPSRTLSQSLAKAAITGLDMASKENVQAGLERLAAAGLLVNYVPA